LNVFPPMMPCGRCVSAFGDESGLSIMSYVQMASNKKGAVQIILFKEPYIHE